MNKYASAYISGFKTAGMWTSPVLPVIGKLLRGESRVAPLVAKSGLSKTLERIGSKPMFREPVASSMGHYSANPIRIDDLYKMRAMGAITSIPALGVGAAYAGIKGSQWLSDFIDKIKARFA